MSYAVIRTGGKQYRVSAGSRLTVEKLEGEPGAEVSFGEVLLRGDGNDLLVRGVNRDQLIGGLGLT